VGVASEDEMICVSVVIDASTTGGDDLKDVINRELPVGCEVTSVDVAGTNAGFRAVRAVYEFDVDRSVRDSGLDGRVSRLSEDINAGGSLVVERHGGKGKSSRTLDVSGYVRSVEREGDKVVFVCEITPEGTIRVDEMLGLLGIGMRDVRGEMRRRSVVWE
jgi:hypothetical protein